MRGAPFAMVGDLLFLSLRLFGHLSRNSIETRWNSILLSSRAVLNRLNNFRSFKKNRSITEKWPKKNCWRHLWPLWQSFWPLWRRPRVVRPHPPPSGIADSKSNATKIETICVCCQTVFQARCVRLWQKRCLRLSRFEQLAERLAQAAHEGLVRGTLPHGARAPQFAPPVPAHAHGSSGVGAQRLANTDYAGGNDVPPLCSRFNRALEFKTDCNYRPPVAKIA